MDEAMRLLNLLTDWEACKPDEAEGYCYEHELPLPCPHGQAQALILGWDD